MSVLFRPSHNFTKVVIRLPRPVTVRRGPQTRPVLPILVPRTSGTTEPGSSVTEGHVPQEAWTRPGV